MKKGWEINKLGDVLKLEYGKPLPDSRRNPAGKYPVYGANGEKSRSDEYYSDEQSIIVGRKGSAGEINLTENRFWPLDVTYFVTFDKTKYDLSFLYNLLFSLELQGMAKGVKPGINRNDVYSISAAFPPLPEQKRIVAVLDKAFAAIDKAKANAEKNLANAKELFEGYLNGVFSTTDEHGLTRIREGWEEKRLGDVCVKIQDGAHASPQKLYSESGNNRFLYITSKNIRNNYMELSKISYCDKSFHDSIYPRCNPELGDILLTKDGANTGNITLNTIEEPFSLLSSVCLIKTEKNSLVPKFLKYFIQSPTGFQQIIGKMTGTAIKRIILKTIKSATIHLPTIQEQNGIVTRLDALSSESKKLEQIYNRKIAYLDELKKSILKRAFEGEV